MAEVSPHSFQVPIHARWPDMDQNGHMKAEAYLGVAEDSRMLYFASVGLTMDIFAARRIGPVVLSDNIVYRRELRLLDRATVHLELVEASADAASFLLRNTIVRDADAKVSAVITSDVRWLDLDKRRVCIPPAELAQSLVQMPHSNDFAERPSPFDQS